LPDNYINSITTDDYGTVWICTSSGITSFNGTIWTTYNQFNSGLPEDYVVKIHFDDDGLMWVATDGGGLVTFNGKDWQYLNEGIHDYYLSSMCFDTDGSVWVGTWNDGIGHYDGTNWTVYNVVNSPLSDNYINSLHIDNIGSKWITTKFGGINIFNENGAPFSVNESIAFHDPIFIYPNPASDFLIIEDLPESNHAFLEIITVQGQLVQKQNVSRLINRVKVADLPSGVYVLRLSWDKEVKTTKMIKN
jgi:ligand-binding sensor domain-containing protein